MQNDTFLLKATRTYIRSKHQSMKSFLLTNKKYGESESSDGYRGLQRVCVRGQPQPLAIVTGVGWSTAALVAWLQVVARATVEARLEQTLVHILALVAHQLPSWPTAVAG